MNLSSLTIRPYRPETDLSAVSQWLSEAKHLAWKPKNLRDLPFGLVAEDPEKGLLGAAFGYIPIQGEAIFMEGLLHPRVELLVDQVDLLGTLSLLVEEFKRWARSENYSVLITTKGVIDCEPGSPIRWESLPLGTQLSSTNENITRARMLADIARAGQPFEVANADYLVRPFSVETDHAMVNEWFLWHEQYAVPAPFLSKLGVIVQECHGEVRKDVAALWCHMSNSCGVCFVEPVVTCPMLSVKRSKAALLRGLDFLKHETARLGYSVMMLRAYPAMARFAKEVGFVADERPIISMSAITTKPEEILCQ